VSTIASFVDGGISESVFSFDYPLVRMGLAEITGDEGTLIVPDPDLFTGDFKITRAPEFAAIGTTRSRRTWRSPACTPSADSASSTWPGPQAPAGRRWPPASSATTSVTHPRRHRRGHHQDRVESCVDQMPLITDDHDPYDVRL
jgi:hypothetical protein